MKEDFRVRSLGLLPFPKQISYCEINLTTSFCISIYCLFPSLVNCCFVGASSRLWSSYQFCFLEPRYPPWPEFPWYLGKSSRTELFFQLSYFEFLIFIADTSVWTQLIHLQEGFLNFLCLCWPNHEIRLPVNRIIIFFIKQLACTELIAYISFLPIRTQFLNLKIQTETFGAF